MKKIILFVTIIFPLFSLNSLISGYRDAGNGGDGIFCNANQTVFFPIDGYYHLDYALMAYNTLPVIDEPNSLDDSYNRILDVLKKIPRLHQLFQKFVTNSQQLNNWGNDEVWVPLGRLEDIKDELIPSGPQGKNKTKGLVPPPNCKTGEPSTYQINQAIIRYTYLENPQQKNRPTIFEFNQEVLDQLEATSILQLSFAYVHEFLWQFTEDVRVIRQLNHFFHSQKLSTLNEESLVQWLNNMGMPIFRTATEVKLQDAAYYESEIEFDFNNCQMAASTIKLKLYLNQQQQDSWLNYLARQLGLPIYHVRFDALAEFQTLIFERFRKMKSTYLEAINLVNNGHATQGDFTATLERSYDRIDKCYNSLIKLREHKIWQYHFQLPIHPVPKFKIFNILKKYSCSYQIESPNIEKNQQCLGPIKKDNLPNDILTEIFLYFLHHQRVSKTFMRQLTDYVLLRSDLSQKQVEKLLKAIKLKVNPVIPTAPTPEGEIDKLIRNLTSLIKNYDLESEVTIAEP